MAHKVAQRERRPIDWNDVLAYEVGDEELASIEELGLSRTERMSRYVIDQCAAGNFRVPMLPAAASEALALANNPDAAVRDIERVVRRDAVVSARVIAVANSAIYAGNGVIRNLKAALMRLGGDNVRDILYRAVAEAHIFRGADAKALQRERDHAVVTAWTASKMCGLLSIDSEYAYLCGLLHDLGRPILLDVFSRCPPPDTAEEREEVVVGAHGPIGAHVSRAWGLPGTVTEAIERHHEYRGFEGQDSYSQIGNIVAVADRLVQHFGFGRKPRPIDFDKEGFFYELGLSPDDVGQLLEQLNQNGAELLR